MKKIISTENAPKAIGPYSQAIEVNGMLFISGQIPIDPSTGKIIDGGINEQTEQVMKNIGAILREAGFDYKDVVKLTEDTMQYQVMLLLLVSWLLATHQMKP